MPAWVDAYVHRWRTSDVTGVAELFSPDVRYLKSPYAEAAVGHAAVAAFWRDDLGQTFEVSSEVVAVEGRNAVARLQVTYLAPEQQEYRDLRVMQFAMTAASSSSRTGRTSPASTSRRQRSSAPL